MPLFHVVVYVPINSADAVRKALAESGAGKIGEYDSCSFSSTGIGRFRPLPGANPHEGKVGSLTEVAEERIEVVVEEEKLSRVLTAVKKVHPYEEPAIHLWRMESYIDYLR